MSNSKRKRRIGILTAGGDSPGLNAAIRSIGKTAISEYGMDVIGFLDGYSGLIEDRSILIEKNSLAGILTVGGTILGTSRLKPHKVKTETGYEDMRGRILENYDKHKLDALVCIGGGGTHKNALKLSEAGLNIVTLPKTIDNDITCTDSTIGFDTALGIATDILDRLHSTAHSHHRIIVAEIMGHNAGWLALGAGIAAGADVILLPEIPYDTGKIAAAIQRRRDLDTPFSIVAVAEGAYSVEHAKRLSELKALKKEADDPTKKAEAKVAIKQLESEHNGNTMRLAGELENLTGLEARVTILGYVQRGGTPSCADRLLATKLGSACVALIADRQYGMMVGVRGRATKPVPLSEVAGNLKCVPLDHDWIRAARSVGTTLGD